MTDREHAEINERLATARDREDSQYKLADAGKVTTGRLGAVAGPYSDTGTTPAAGRNAIRSEINRLTGHIEMLKALDGALAKDLSPLADDAVRTVVLALRSVR